MRGSTDPTWPSGEFSIAAVRHGTPSEPLGPFVAPGTYTIRLRVDLNSTQRPIRVLLDPRVSMTEPVARETVVSLQHKLLFLLNILQGADARPTSQATAASLQLLETLAGLKARWETLR